MSQWFLGFSEFPEFSEFNESSALFRENSIVSIRVMWNQEIHTIPQFLTERKRK